MKHVAVIGGGLAGLTAAYRLGLAGHEVTLFEAAARLGGQLWTAREDGWVVELGAEGFVARSEALPRLAADLARTNGAGADEHGWLALLDQQATTSFRFDGHALRALAPGEAAEALSFQVAASARGAGIRTFAGGMQSLVEALATAVRAPSDVRLAQPIASLESEGAGVRLGGVAYDAVVVATSSGVAARLLAPLLGETALGRVETLSSVTVSLGYDAQQVADALAGTGFVVGEPFEGFRACTFTTSKFARRAPEGSVSLRVFFRPTAAELEVETPWEARAASVLGRVLTLDGAPTRTWVSRWPNALPVFTAEHRATVAAVEARLAGHAIHLAGSAFHGSGIDAAVLSAEKVAARVAG